MANTIIMTRIGRISRPPTRFADEYERYYSTTKVVVSMDDEVPEIVNERPATIDRKVQVASVLGAIGQLPDELIREILSFVIYARRSSRIRRAVVRFADEYDCYYK